MNVIFVVIVALLMFNNNVLARPSSLKQTFDKFKNAFNKTYSSDLSLDEQHQTKIDNNFISIPFCVFDVNTTIPNELDLRSFGTLPPIRMQGNCASSWAFAAIATLESARLSKNPYSIDLSVQELIDCASQNGCSGDNIQRGLNDLKLGIHYISRNGVVKESDYSYVEHSQLCRRFTGISRYETDNYCQFAPQNTTKIRLALARTLTAIPAIIAIKDLKSFQHYDGLTIIRDDNYSDQQQQVTYHTINIVGYGNFQGTDYWIIRNSWDITWGDKGYGYIVANKNLMEIEQYAFSAYLL